MVSYPRVTSAFKVSIIFLKARVKPAWERPRETSGVASRHRRTTPGTFSRRLAPNPRTDRADLRAHASGTRGSKHSPPGSLMTRASSWGYCGNFPSAGCKPRCQIPIEGRCKSRTWKWHGKPSEHTLFPIRPVLTESESTHRCKFSIDAEACLSLAFADLLLFGKRMIWVQNARRTEHQVWTKARSIPIYENNVLSLSDVLQMFRNVTTLLRIWEDFVTLWCDQSALHHFQRSHLLVFSRNLTHFLPNWLTNMN